MSKYDEFIEKNSIGYLISIAGLRYKGETWRRLKPFGITPEQWVVLNRLSEGDGVSQRELADRIVKDQPNTTRILDKMAQKGLIRRDPDPQDRRAFLIFLTSDGRRLRDKLLPIVQELRKISAHGFSEEEIMMLKNLLRRFTGNLS
ncbi:MAG: MarR family transcriptional regulator [Geobacteraceae bacterium]|nr:MarR family transcriptional regulator [Geobacteraceae bacterium]